MTQEPLRDLFCPDSHDRLLGDALDLIGSISEHHLEGQAAAILRDLKERADATAADFPFARVTFGIAVDAMTQTGFALTYHGDNDDQAVLQATCAAAAPFFRTALPAEPHRHWSVGADLTLSLLRSIEAVTGRQLLSHDDNPDESRLDLPGPTLFLAPSA